MKIVLFGAGSAQFGYGTLGDIFQSHVLKGAEIVLVDINAEALAKVARTASNFVASKNLNFKITSTTNANSALPGADFVIISIEVGSRFDLWDMDWKIPLQFGVRQIYGENGGPGGIFHALRITPPILNICKSVERLCPNAVVMNFSNPMTAITTTVLRRFPQMKFVGLCHEISSLSRYLPHILDTKLDNLFFRAAGLNHFSVLLEARYKDSNQDAYPEILRQAPKFFEFEPGFSDLWAYSQQTGELIDTEGSLERWNIDNRNPSRTWSDRWLFRAILETYSLLPITIDSHLGEYISWAQDTADHQGIQDFYDFYRVMLCDNERVDLESNEVRERVMPLMEGIVTNAGFEEGAVNMLNQGSIPDFPDSVAVEIPAIVDSKGFTPVKFESYPKGFGALVRSYAGVYDILAEAILQGSRDLVVQAVLACPGVTTYRHMGEMVDYMISRQREWLGHLK